MKGIRIEDNKIIVELSFDELKIIVNSLNEICNKIESWEFETRLGIDIEEARKILEDLTSIYINLHI